MRWNKNIASYIAWGILAAFSISGLAYTGVLLSKQLEFPFFAGIAVGIVAAICVCGLKFVLDKSFRLKRDSSYFSLRSELEYFSLLLVSIVGGLIYRWSMLEELDKHSPYFELTKMTLNQKAPHFVHGAVNIYISYLHTVFYVFGNNYMIAVYAQIALFVLAVLFLCLGVRLIAGKTASVVTAALLMFTSVFAEYGFQLSPIALLLFLWSAAFLISCTSVKIKNRFVAALLLIPAGFIAYLDVSGIWLFVIYCILLSASTDKFADSISKICIGAAVAAVVFFVSFFASIFVDAIYTGKGFLPILKAWFAANGFSAPKLPVYMSESLWTWQNIVLFILLSVGVYSFWVSKNRESIKGWVVLLVTYLLCTFFIVPNAQVPMDKFFYMALFLMIAMVIHNISDEPFAVVAKVEVEKKVNSKEADVEAEKPKKEKPKKEKPIKEKKTKDEEKIKPVNDVAETAVNTSDNKSSSDAKTKDTSEEESRYVINPEFKDKEITFLENPLPLPKLAKKKKVDYDSDGDDDDDYDYEVADDDDYDIP